MVMDMKVYTTVYALKWKLYTDKLDMYYQMIHTYENRHHCYLDVVKCSIFQGFINILVFFYPGFEVQESLFLTHPSIVRTIQELDD